MKKSLKLLRLLFSVSALLLGCSKEPLFDGSDNGLLSFSLEGYGVTYEAAISGDQILITVPAGTDLSNCTAIYQLCEQATIVPDPSTINNWNSQQIFRVTSHSQLSREYTYILNYSDVTESGNVELLTQADLDNFVSKGVTYIDGNLIIGSDSDAAEGGITSLEGLSSLKEIRYNLIINRSFGGSSLEGLENLERCGGIQIGSRSTSLTLPSTEGLSVELPNLLSTGDLIINSPSLKSLSLKKVKSFSSLFLVSNSITAVTLPQLEEVVTDFSMENSSSGVNSLLSEVELPLLNKVGGKFAIAYFSGLNSLLLPSLATIGGDLNLALNSSQLEEISLPKLSSINGSIIVERAPALKRLSFEKVEEVSSLIFNKTSYGNYPLEELKLPLLNRVKRDIYLRGFVAESLSLPALTKVAGEIVLWDLKLASTIELPSIEEVGSKIQLYSATLLEEFKISTLQSSITLELVGCLALATVEAPTSLLNLTINYASNAATPTPQFVGLEEIEGKLDLSNGRRTSSFVLDNIKSIGSLTFNSGQEGALLSLPKLENIETLNITSLYIGELNLPKLESVKSLIFNNVSKLTTINMAALKSVESFSLTEHSSWNLSLAVITDLSVYSHIATVESIESVTINYCNKLVDFSHFAPLITLLEANSWSVSNCGYNPTYQEMVDGNYSLP